MAAITKLGDLITQIQNRSTATVTYSVALSTINPGGWYDCLKNGVRTWSFLWPPIGKGDMACGYTDANPNGLLIEVLSSDGTTSGKADVAQFVLSLN